MQNVKPLLEMYKMAGIPIDEQTEQNVENMYNDPYGTMALSGVGEEPAPMESPMDDQLPMEQLPMEEPPMEEPPMEEPPQEQLPQNDMGGGEVYPEFDNQIMGSPPMDDALYDDMMIDVRGDGVIPTDYEQSDTAQDWEYGRNYE